MIYHRPRKPALKTSIERFQADWKISLPKTYIDFLLLADGGRPDRCVYKYIGRRTGKERRLTVERFFSVSGSGDGTLGDAMKTYYRQRRIPKEVVPIAEVVGGDLLCIELTDYGRLHVWRHEDEGGIPSGVVWPPMNAISLVADRFDVFIDALQPDE